MHVSRILRAIIALIVKFPHSFPGTVIERVQAVAQTNTGVQITYSLKDDRGWFEINSTTGVITVARTLDREVIKQSCYYQKGSQSQQVLN